MSYTLKAAGETCEDALTKGIIEIVLKDCPLLQMLPFITIEGNTLTYWQEKEISGLAAWRSPGAEWADAKAPGTEEKTATLKILGGDIDFDYYTRRTRPRPEDYDAHLVDLKAKAMRYEFENCAINGDPSQEGYEDEFVGLHKLIKGTAWESEQAYAVGDTVVPTVPNGFKYVCTVAGTSGASEPSWPEVVGTTKTDGTVTWTCYSGHHLCSGSNGASLSFSHLDQLIDLVQGGPADLLLMSRRSRRKLQSLIRASGAVLESRPGMFGESIQLYNGIPVVVSDFIKDSYVVGGSENCSVIFALQLSESAVAGISTPKMIDVERMGKLETKDAERIRIKWYTSLALFSLPRAALLSGVKD